MTKDTILKKIKSIAKKVARKAGGILITNDITDQFVFELKDKFHTYKRATVYKVEDKLDLHTGSVGINIYTNCFVYSIYNTVDIDEINSEEWQKVFIKEFNFFDKVTLGGDDYMLNLFMIHKEGKPAYIKKNIKSYVSRETSDLFGGLYD